MTRRRRERALPEAGRLRSIVDFYLTTMRTAVQQQFQYRVATYFYMFGMVAEPVIYLVVWTTIAEQQGGSIQGLSVGYFAAYYIVWTLVRNMNIVFGAPFWEYRIREGHLSGQLLRPLHPLHHDIAHFAGCEGRLDRALAPDRIRARRCSSIRRSTRRRSRSASSRSRSGARTCIRTMFQSALGMLCFWTTRGAAVFNLYMTAGAACSRAASCRFPLMPDWVEDIARFLPFQWAFFFPIESLVGDLSTEELLGGLVAQAALDPDRRSRSSGSPGGSRSGASRRWATDERACASPGCS